MIIDFKRKPRSRGLTATQQLADIGAEMVDPAELAAMEAADEIKLEQLEQRRQARERDEAPPAKQKAASGFVMVPLVWIERLSIIDPSGAWQLAMALLYRANLKEQFPVTDAFVTKAKVKRSRKHELLERFGKAGLVTVERRPVPKAPLVSLRLRRERTPPGT